MLFLVQPRQGWIMCSVYRGFHPCTTNTARLLLTFKPFGVGMLPEHLMHTKY
jgi:hypothetical protein